MGLRGAAAHADWQLLGGLLLDLTDVFDCEVLPLLDPTTGARLARVGLACRDAVLRCPKLPCAGRTVGVKLQVDDFVGSVVLLAWSVVNACPSGSVICGGGLRSSTFQLNVSCVCL